MVSCSFVHLCCVTTPCYIIFGAWSHPYIPLHFEEMILPLVSTSFNSLWKHCIYCYSHSDVHGYQKQNESWNVHTDLQKALEAESSSAAMSTSLVTRAHSGLDNAPALRMGAAHWCWVSSKWRCSVSTMEELSDLRQDINDRLMLVHTSGEIGDVQWKNQRFNFFQQGSKEEDEE